MSEIVNTFYDGLPTRDEKVCFYILSFIDDLLLLGRFDVCDDILAHVTKGLSIQVSLAIICSCCPAREKLSHYKTCYDNLYAWYTEQVGEDEARKLLQGLQIKDTNENTIRII